MRLLFKIILGQMRAKKLQTLHMLLSLILSVAMVTVVCAAFDALKAPYAMSPDSEEYWDAVYTGRVFIGITAVLCSVTVAAAFAIEAEERIRILGFLSSVGMHPHQQYLFFLIEWGMYIVPAIPAGIALGYTGVRELIAYCLRLFVRFSGKEPPLARQLSSVPVLPGSIITIAVLTFTAAGIAAGVTLFRMRRASLLTIIKRNSRINVALKETLLSRISKKLFGRIGALAGQNYENYKWQYRFISLALSGGTTFFMLIYSYFHYGVVIYAMRDSSSPIESNPAYAMRYHVYGLACLFVFVFLFCALGFLRRSIDVRKRDLIAYVSVGISRADMIRMNVIESGYLAWYALLYGLIGSLIANYALLFLLRITSSGKYLIPFSFPIWGMWYFVVLDLAVGVLYAVYSAWRLSRMDILDAIRVV